LSPDALLHLLSVLEGRFGIGFRKDTITFSTKISPGSSIPAISVCSFALLL